MAMMRIAKHGCHYQSYEMQNGILFITRSLHSEKKCFLIQRFVCRFLFTVHYVVITTELFYFIDFPLANATSPKISWTLSKYRCYMHMNQTNVPIRRQPYHWKTVNNGDNINIFLFLFRRVFRRNRWVKHAVVCINHFPCECTTLKKKYLQSHDRSNGLSDYLKSKKNPLIQTSANTKLEFNYNEWIQTTFYWKL